MYPVMLDLRGQPCLVVGGGAVALRKVQGLLGEGARVTVVAEQLCAELAGLSGQQNLALEMRSYRSGEAAGYSLVFAATDDRAVNAEVAADAKRAGVWVNVADDPELCAFHLPARLQRGPLQVAIGSTGEAPFVVRRLRRLLERKLGPEWEEWMHAAADFRGRVRRRFADNRQRQQCYEQFFTASVDAESLRVKVPQQPELERLLSEDGSVPGGAAEVAADSSGPEPAGAGEQGFVSLVGAGPGDAGLLTRRGYQRLLECDAVVLDRLAAPALPPELPERVELHPVGKRAGHHPLAQEDINKLLVRLAQQGKRVVRLKGGDPFVFGRGGEEAEELERAGIAYEVVPGVTAGLAGPAYAGIPVTHRRQVVRVTLVTAHEAVKDDGPQVRWDLLAADPHATIIGYMGVTSLPAVAGKLLGAGIDPATPAALIERATTSRQRRLLATVADIAERAEQQGIKPPAVFVIGPTVGFASALDWFCRRPLFGTRVALVAGARRYRGELERAGAESVEIGLPVSAAARIVMAAAPLAACVFDTPADVEALEEERDTAGFGPETAALCREDETTRAACTLGWIRVATFRDRRELVTRLLGLERTSSCR